MTAKFTHKIIDGRFDISIQNPANKSECRGITLEPSLLEDGESLELAVGVLNDYVQGWSVEQVTTEQVRAAFVR